MTFNKNNGRPKKGSSDFDYMGAHKGYRGSWVPPTGRPFSEKPANVSSDDWEGRSKIRLTLRLRPETKRMANYICSLIGISRSSFFSSCVLEKYNILSDLYRREANV